MPITIRTLIEGRDRPITVAANDSVREALEIMLRHDFTQLPVTTANDAVVGMITSDSIVRAFGAFNVAAEDLRVGDAMRQVPTYDPDDDIAELLDGLRDSYAALVVDSNDRLMAIVTGFDTAEHFRKQFEDLMVVQDIETAIKDHVLYAFAQLRLTDAQIEESIRRVGNPEDRVKKKLTSALKSYSANVGVPVDQEAVLKAIGEVLGTPPQAKFDRLTLVQYCELLLSEECWGALAPIYCEMKPAVMRKLLVSVQKSRNALAHFRGQLTAVERSHLRVCANWFAQHSLPATSASTEPSPLSTLTEASTAIPADEAIDRGEGRYARLAEWLAKRPDSEADLTLTFDEIEVVLQSPLPRSAFAHRSWWANDSVGHPQSINWLDVGWRVANLNLTNRTVTFSRIEGRQGAYIGFFSVALSDLRTRASWGVAGHSPSGANWQLLAGLTSDGMQLAILAWAFARRKQFRTELYIDSGDGPLNKRLFDALYSERASIEARVGRALTWERMNDRRASRIATYSEGSILDSRDRLDKLKTWAVDAAISLHDVLAGEIRKLGDVRALAVRGD